MNIVFADTFYFIAQFNPRDQNHTNAAAFTATFQGRMVTTDWVLVELADAFAEPPNRQRFVAIYELLQVAEELEIIPADPTLLNDGFALYANRPDKKWSLTDCISFTVMERLGITDALTGDHHFEQAGFVALLR